MFVNVNDVQLRCREADVSAVWVDLLSTNSTSLVRVNVLDGRIKTIRVFLNWTQKQLCAPYKPTHCREADHMTLNAP